MCANADHPETETVVAVGAVKTPATCTEKGWTTYTATFTNAAFEQQVREEEDVDALGHAWGEPAYTWAQEDDVWKCTATRACANADHPETETVTATGTIKSPATCTEKGWTTYTATFTNDVFVQQTKDVEDIDALGHTPGEPVQENVLPATCTTAGSYDEVVYCTVCEAELSREKKVTEPLGHDYEAVVTEPTCTEPGYTTHTCSRCSDSYVDSEVEALGHTPGEPIWENVTATCTAAGTGDEVVCCTVCHEELSRETKTVDALGHDLTKTDAVAATCTEAGNSAYWTCGHCGKYFSDENGEQEIEESSWAIPATGHIPGDSVRENEVPAIYEEPGSYDEVVYCTVCHAELSREHKLFELQPPPTITTQPKSVAAFVNTTVKFTVGASNATSYQWQWSEDGAIWNNCSSTGFNTATLQMTATEACNGYEYRCKVSNSAGTTTSSAATLTVLTKPTITTQPTDVTATAGSTVKFTVAASGTGLQYQWQWSEDGATWNNCSSTGFNTTTLQVTATEACNGYKYRCKVSNSAGSVTSDAATLTLLSHTPTAAVEENRVEPTCTEAGSYDEVVYCSVCHEELSRETKTVDALGHDLTKTDAVAATCTEAGNSAYWTCERCHKFFGDENGDQEIEESSWAIPATGHTPGEPVRENEVAATAEAEGHYDEVVYCTVCHAELSREEKIIEKIVIPVTITTQPMDVTAAEGTKAEFTVVASNATSYQWQWSSDNGTTWNNSSSATTGYNTATLQVSATTARNGYKYRCKVTNSDGTTTSSAATLTVSEKPVITTQPKSVTATSGTTAKFTVAATGATSYQWQWSFDGGKNWQNSSSATTGYNTATLQVTATEARNGYMYRCEVSNSAGTVTSSAATLTVVTKPTITTQPKSVTTSAGSTAKFTVAASGTGLKYQWQWSFDGGKNWSNSSSATVGYNTATLQVTATEARNGYQYRCQVTNEAGAVTSSAATLTVSSSKPTITTQPKSVTAAVNTTAKFTVEATNATSYQWQWSFDGGSNWQNSSSATTGYNTATLQVTATETRNGYMYRCKVTNSAGTVTSSAATLTVVTKPTITTQPKSVTTSAGSTAKFTVAASGTGLKYQWQWSFDGGNNWQNSSSATTGYNTATLQVTATEARNGYMYRCKVTNSAGTVTTSAAKLTVN